MKKIWVVLALVLSLMSLALAGCVIYEGGPYPYGAPQPYYRPYYRPYGYYYPRFGFYIP